MASISDIKTTVTVPDEISIALIRADYYQVSNIFRIFFEVFLACSSAILESLTGPHLYR